MATIIIYDLEKNTELNQNTMSNVVGGFKIKFKNVQITSYQISASGNDEYSPAFGAGDHEYLLEPNSEMR